MEPSRSVAFPSNGEGRIATDAQAAQPTQEEQCTLLNQSLLYLGMVLAGTLLSFSVVGQQRDAICQGETPPDPFCRQLLASLFTVAALCYFYRLAGQTLETDPCDCFAKLNWAASVMVLVAAIIHLFLLLAEHSTGSTAPTEMQEEIEDTPTIE